jgi:hypothetical protein
VRNTTRSAKTERKRCTDESQVIFCRRWEKKRGQRERKKKKEKERKGDKKEKGTRTEKGTAWNGINLALFSLAAQAFTQDFPWLVQAVILFRPPFHRPWFKPARTLRIDFQLPERRPRSRVTQSAERVREADTLHGHALPLGRHTHHRPNQVIHQREHRQFLENSVHCLTMEYIHLHRLL